MFGQHLLHKGLITNEQLIKALDHQLHSRVWLGRLAFEEELPDLEQVVEILEQQDATQTLFREAAVQLGHLTATQRDHLLEKQKQRSPLLRQVLAELGLVSVEVLEEELEEYESSAAKASHPPSSG